MLRAHSTIAVGEAAGLIERLCDRYAEHGTVARSDGRSEIRLAYGRAGLRPGPSGLEVDVEAGSAIHLSYVKMGIVENVLEMAAGPVADIRWTGDGGEGGLPLFFRELRVVSAEPLSPRMRRLRLAGDDLARFREDGLHVGLLFAPKGRAPIWPMFAADGRLVYPQGEDRLERRVYTLRRIDAAAGTVEIDMVLHEGEGMPGADFARLAGPGDRVGMTGPGGGGVPAAQALFCFGDETALPAIARMLEERPAGTRLRAVIEVETAEDRLDLSCPEGAEIEWLVRSRGPATLAERARATDFDSLGPDSFVWAGCEFADFKAIRAHLRRDLRLPRERHRVAAYWRRGRRGDQRFAEE